MSYIRDDEPTSTEKSQAEKDDNEYWSDCNAETTDFQHSRFLQSVFYYSQDHISKQAYRTSSLSGEAYIEEPYVTFSMQM